MNSQCNEILNHLQTRGPINPVDALFRYGCMRLGARIWDLKRDGHDIRTTFESAQNRYGEKVNYARYTMH